MVMFVNPPSSGIASRMRAMSARQGTVTHEEHKQWLMQQDGMVCKQRALRCAGCVGRGVGPD